MSHTAAGSPRLAEIVTDLTGRGADLHLSIGAVDDSWRPWAALAADEAALAEALRKEGEFNGLDPKGQAAYLVGTLGYALSSTLIALRSVGLDIAGATSDRLHYRQELVHWEEGEESGDYNRMILRLADDLPVAAVPASTEAMRLQLVALIEPALLRMHAVTGLPKAALWRQAADNVASGFLYTGRPLGFEQGAIDEGLLLLRTPASPLTNKQTGFFTLTVTDEQSGRSLTQTYRARGGCCRAYTCGDGTYCSTCVLTSIEERDQRISSHMLMEIRGRA